MQPNDQFFHRMIDIIEQDVVPLTLRGVKMGAKAFGAAIVKRKDLSLVLATTNTQYASPLWHGELNAIREFYELQRRPEPSECLLLATHQPCCMCASAVAWGGFPECWYLFGYEQTEEDFNVPFDIQMIRDIFGTDRPNQDNAYYKMRSLAHLIPELPDPALGQKRYEAVRSKYAELAEIFQNTEKIAGMGLV
ncbi:hypothetical protein LJB99_06625 [Deltaproteobacteria bacterium OttesenSCG-928-K17]|nr:hypothetical protein [Deltaproteobacteria bacterium OttesenSCG-928-K17]